MKLYLDDLKVGDTFQSKTYTLSEEKVIQFANEFDPQPFHTNEQSAKNSFFGQLVASGWHTAAITMRLITESLPFAHGIIGAGGEIKWTQPTYPNDTLYVKSTIKEIKYSKSKPNQGLVIVECNTFNQHDERCQQLVTTLDRKSTRLNSSH